MAAITYVMLSRICALTQLYILDEFDESKMYPSQIAMEELERLQEISINNNPTDWEKENSRSLKISSLNCRSLKKHFPDIKVDEMLLKSDIICLQETWLEKDETIEDFDIPNYNLHLNSYGRGKGIAIYFKKDKLRHKIDVTEENLQLSMFSGDVIDLVVLYRSQSGSHGVIIETLETMLDESKPVLVIGDFNFCYADNSSNLTGRYLDQSYFKQLVKEPTHIEGNLIDQAHVRDASGVHQYSVELHSKYYTDHKGIAVLIKRLVIGICFKKTICNFDT